jgi:hypothetical protein
LPAVPSIASTSLGTSGSPAVESLTFSAAGPSVNRSERALPAAHPAGFLDPFGGVGWGLILLAVAAALALGYGLRRYALAVDAAGAERPAH